MTVVGCYISSNTTIETFNDYIEQLETVVREQRGKRILITGDFNAKSHRWGGTQEDARGAILAEWVDGNDLNVMNRGNAPTFTRGSSESFIDLTVQHEYGRAQKRLESSG